MGLWLVLVSVSFARGVDVDGQDFEAKSHWAVCF